MPGFGLFGPAIRLEGSHELREIVHNAARHLRSEGAVGEVDGNDNGLGMLLLIERRNHHQLEHVRGVDVNAVLLLGVVGALVLYDEDERLQKGE